MQGAVQSSTDQGGQGAILGDDGKVYAFTPLGWRDSSATASVGGRVDFDVRGDHAVAINPLPESESAAGERPASPSAPSALPTPGSSGVLRGATPLSPPQSVKVPSPLATPVSAAGASQQLGRSVQRGPQGFPQPGAPTQSVSQGFAQPGAPMQPPRAIPTPVPRSQPASFPVAQPASFPVVQSVQVPVAPSPPIVQGQGVGMPPGVPPVSPTGGASRFGTEMFKSRIVLFAVLGVVLLGVAAVGLFLLLGSSQSDEEIAAQVATEWAHDSINSVTEMLVGFVIGDLPFITSSIAEYIAELVREYITWGYSEPSCPAEGRCDVKATARVSMDVNIPLVMNSTVTVKMPFDLDIATGSKSVRSWYPDFGGASVQGLSLGSGGGSVSGALSGFSSDFDFDDISDSFDDFADDFDDISDSFDDFADDIEFDFDDVSDSFDDFADDFDDVSDSFDDFADDFDDVGDSISESLGDLW